MRDELDVIKWWVVVGFAALVFHKLGKAAVNIWNAPQPVKDLFD